MKSGVIEIPAPHIRRILMLSPDYHRRSREGYPKVIRRYSSFTSFDSGKVVCTSFPGLHCRQRSSRLLYRFLFFPPPALLACCACASTDERAYHMQGVFWGGMCLRHTRLCRSQAPLDINLTRSCRCAPLTETAMRHANIPLHIHCVSEYENGTPFLTPTYLLLERDRLREERYERSLEC
jgi:hypothetical protein